MIAGVCGGLGDYFNLDPTLIRVIFAILAIVTSGSFALLYVLLWIIMPQAPKIEGLSIETAAPTTMATLEAPATDASFTPEEVKAWNLTPAGVQPDAKAEGQQHMQ
jgi:phage shock protein C